MPDYRMRPLDTEKELRVLLGQAHAAPQVLAGCGPSQRSSVRTRATL